MLQYRRATTIREIELMQRLRYRVYCEEKHFLDSKSYQEFRETDQYDQYATHYVFADSETPEQLVGCLRFIKANPLGFPLETVAGISVDAQTRPHTAEMSRLIIDPQFRGHSASIFLPMIKTAYLFCRQQDVRYFIALAERALGELYRRYGTCPHEITNGRWHMNGFVIPYFNDWADVDRQYARKSPRFHRYLTEPTPDHPWVQGDEFNAVLQHEWPTAEWSVTLQSIAAAA